MAELTQQQRDARIQALHAEAGKMWTKLEKIIDELKKLGPHSLDRANAILNTEQHLKDLSERCKTRPW